MNGTGWRRRLRFLATCAGLCVVVGLVGSYFSIRSLLERRSPPFAEAPPPRGSEEVRLKTSDGETLGAWYFAPPADAPTVILFHGLGGSRSSSAGAADFWAHFGCGALLVTLRCHGDSTGERHDLGYRCAPDVVAAVDFARQRRPDSPIVVQGISMGAASAIFASQTLETRVAGFILESPYRDLRTAIRHRAEAQTPWLVSGFFQRCSSAVARLAAPDVDRVAPIEHIGRIPKGTPVWILTGEADVLARPSEAEALFAKVADHGRLVRFPEAGHVPLIDADPRRYRATMAEFLDAVRRSTHGG
jgi:alpha-beta hydrolase superfamily lysophospholipase